MAELPKIARERLSSQAGEHLDPNLLSAFAEGTLSEHERGVALEHLAGCAGCREVLAVVSPDPEQVQPAVFSKSAARSWWRSPLVHWSALIAAAAVVLIAVIVGPHRERHGLSASAPANAPSSDQLPTPQVSTYIEGQAEVQNPKPQPQPQKEPVNAIPTSRAKAAAGIAGSVSKSQSFKGERPVPAPPPVSADANIQSGVVGGAKKLPMQSSGNLVTAPVAATPAPERQLEERVSPGYDRDKFEPQAAKVAPPSSTTQSVEVTAEAALPQAQTTVLNSNRAYALKRQSFSGRWSISSSGGLQRSLDGGRTWRQIAVSGNASFRAVTAIGNDVWAGGSGGVLFHSSDAGERWTQVRVQSKTAALSGDIVQVDFTDANHGLITTSTGETWATPDAGVTWQRQ